MEQPKDPILLMSVVNTYLRDKYPDISYLCDDLEWNEKELKNKLKEAGFTYRPDVNQFR